VVHGELETQDVGDAAVAEALNQRNEAQVARLLLEGIEDQVENSIGLQMTAKTSRLPFYRMWSVRTGSCEK
jgi:hypothetical protein